MGSQLKRGVLELCVFAVLNGADCYGYKLVNIISESIDVTEGTVYPLLKRMKDDGFLSTYLAESGEGPPRKFYRITVKGRAEMAKQFKEYKEFVAGVQRLLKGGGLFD